MLGAADAGQGGGGAFGFWEVPTSTLGGSHIHSGLRHASFEKSTHRYPCYIAQILASKTTRIFWNCGKNFKKN